MPAKIFGISTTVLIVVALAVYFLWRGRAQAGTKVPANGGYAERIAQKREFGKVIVTAE